MNKRGELLFILLIVATILILIQGGMPKEAVNEVINGQALNWTHYYSQIHTSLQTSIDNSDNPLVELVITCVDKFIDLIGYTVMAVAKLAAEYTRDHPDIINGKVLMYLIVFSLVAPLIYPIFVIIVSLILIIKEWWVARKEKEALKALKQKRGIYGGKD